MEFATQCRVKGRVGGENSQVAPQITSSGRTRAVMVSSEGGSKGLSYTGGSVGQGRRAEEDPVVLWDPTGKGGVGFMNKRDENGCGVPESQLGSRLKMMRCSSPTTTEQL